MPVNSPHPPALHQLQIASHPLADLRQSPDDLKQVRGRKTVDSPHPWGIYGLSRPAKMGNSIALDPSISDKPPMAVAGHPRPMKWAGHPADVAAFLVP
jgi:hypothetical protein